MKSDLGGEEIEPQEVEFLEKFEVLGHRVTWIPRAPYVSGRGRRSTNDFVWNSNGYLVYELENTSASYKKIKIRIQEAVQKSLKHGVETSVFMIDLGDRKLTEKLAGQLSQYNQ